MYMKDSSELAAECSEQCAPGDEECAAEGGTNKSGYKITVRIKVPAGSHVLDNVIDAIDRAEGHLSGVTSHGVDDGFAVRDIMIVSQNRTHAQAVVEQLKSVEHVQVVNVSDRTFLMHLGGKLNITPRRPARNMDDLSMIYTPGVADVCMAIAADPAKARTLTIQGNLVAVVTDGSRILSLGNIGSKAGAPVMEGKCALFNQFADVFAIPVLIRDQTVDAVVETIYQIAPGLGAINLEDIASPRCYEIQEKLQAKLDIPVFHDDQDGTAIVVLAGTINAAKLTKKRLSSMKVVVCGVGAAGMACSKLLLAAGVKNLIGFNVSGPVHRGREGLTAQEQWLAEHSNPKNFSGTLEEALKGADMFLGLSVAGAIKPEWLAAMKKNAICFALANPTPEVSPRDAKPYVTVMATGGSNYPNQINNALVFPGFFRGLLDSQVSRVTGEMKMEAARALAACVERSELDFDKIIPDIFEAKAHAAVAEAVRRVAKRNKLGRYA